MEAIEERLSDLEDELLELATLKGNAEDEAEAIQERIADLTQEEDALVGERQALEREYRRLEQRERG
jgi:predicted  nucleic acid-binding Zn-ribbon protein